MIKLLVSVYLLIADENKALSVNDLLLLKLNLSSANKFCLFVSAVQFKECSIMDELRD